MSKGSALIVGHTGQDGSYLADLLGEDGLRVVGLSSRRTTDSDNEHTSRVDICNTTEVSRLIDAVRPTELYFLAAWHHSSEEEQPSTRELLAGSYAIHCDAFSNVLDAVFRLSPSTKVFYASSSHVFGQIHYTPQNETHPITPQNVYGLTKAYGMQIAQYYREHHSVFVNCGILYNHESPRRDAKFLSRKIARGVADIRQGRETSLKIGDPTAVIDWGHAADYVRAMRASLSIDEPSDFIIASGASHTVRQFAELAFEAGGLPPETPIEIDETFRGKPEPSMSRVGDTTRLKCQTGWEPEYDFNALVRELVAHSIAEGSAS